MSLIDEAKAMARSVQVIRRYSIMSNGDQKIRCGVENGSMKIRKRRKERRPAYCLSTMDGPALALFRYIPSLVKTGRTGAEMWLIRRSPESVNDINNPANR